MTSGTDIADYNAGLEESHRQIAEALQQLIDAQVPDAAGKVWHGHPVWFLNGNPIVGYSLKKSGIEVLFWSGQSFARPGLRAIGSYSAAAVSIPSLADLPIPDLSAWLSESITIQWDHANLPSRKRLDKLTEF